MLLLRQTCLLFASLTLLTGIVYPLLTTFVAQLVFPYQANGSLLVKDGTVIGSELVGQNFRYSDVFWGRPSATSPACNGTASGGSNLGPTNPVLRERLFATANELRAAHPNRHEPIPVDLLTTSASGLDPHISPAAAEYQALRVAEKRHISVARVRQLIQEHTQPRQLGILGEPRVNVVQLNRALQETARDVSQLQEPQP